MSRPQRPSRSKARRRRVAAAAITAFAVIAVYLALVASVFAPVDEHGARVVHLTVRSQAVGEDLGVSVVVPPRLADPRGERPLLVFLHGRGGSDRTFTGDEAVFEGLAKLGGDAPIIAFP